MTYGDYRYGDERYGNDYNPGYERVERRLQLIGPDRHAVDAAVEIVCIANNILDIVAAVLSQRRICKTKIMNYQE